MDNKDYEDLEEERDLLLIIMLLLWEEKKEKSKDTLTQVISSIKILLS